MQTVAQGGQHSSLWSMLRQSTRRFWTELAMTFADKVLHANTAIHLMQKELVLIIPLPLRDLERSRGNKAY